MRILHIGLMVNKKLNIGLSRAFRNAVGKENYLEFELDSDLRQNLTGLDFDPDIVFIQVQNDKIGNQPTGLVLNEALDALRAKGSFVINWTGDIRNSIPSWMQNFTADLTCFSNWTDVYDYRGKSDFLQIGIDPVNFNKDHDQYSLRESSKIPSVIPEIVFMGNNNGQFPISGYRLQIVKSLQKRYGDKFAVYGNGYPNSKGSLNATPDDPYRMQSLESYIYSQCKIAISVSHYNVDGYYSDRLLRCIGSGAFTLSHKYEGVERDWIVDEDLCVFSNFHDLYSKIDYYLQNSEERKKIALNGYRKVHQNHTYSNMVSDIIDLYNKHK